MFSKLQMFAASLFAMLLGLLTPAAFAADSVAAEAVTSIKSAGESAVLIVGALVTVGIAIMAANMIKKMISRNGG